MILTTATASVIAAVWLGILAFFGVTPFGWIGILAGLLTGIAARFFASSGQRAAISFGAAFGAFAVMAIAAFVSPCEQITPNEQSFEAILSDDAFIDSIAEQIIFDRAMNLPANANNVNGATASPFVDPKVGVPKEVRVAAEAKWKAMSATEKEKARRIRRQLAIDSANANQNPNYIWIERLRRLNYCWTTAALAFLTSVLGLQAKPPTESRTIPKPKFRNGIQSARKSA